MPIDRRDRRRASLLACLLLLGGCRDGDAPGTGPEIADRAEREALRRGELLSLACQACHTLRAGESHRIGPNLHGVFGRAAGNQPGFAYSEAMRRSGIVWTRETLENWMAAPEAFLPGTTMVFAGYADPEDRRVLLDYLVEATASGSSP